MLQSNESYKCNLSDPSINSLMFKKVKNFVSKSPDKSLMFQFGSFTFANCECNLILYLTFGQMVRHARGSSKYLLMEKIGQIVLFMSVIRFAPKNS